MAQSAPFLMVGGMLLNAYGTYTEAKAAKEANKVNQRLADFNANVLEWQAEDAIKRGEWSETQYRKQARQMIGSQRAALAAQGVDVNDLDSTAMQIQEDTRQLSEMDALQIRMNAFNEAAGFKVQAVNARLGAELDQMATDAQIRQTLISGAGTALSQAYGFATAGA